jgi:hypothetical protein
VGEVSLALLQHLRQIRTNQVAAIMHLRRVPPRAVAIEVVAPFHHLAIAPVFLDQPADAVAALTLALRALNTQHVELALDVTEYEIGSGHLSSLCLMGVCIASWHRGIQPWRP